MLGRRARRRVRREVLRLTGQRVRGVAALSVDAASEQAAQWDRVTATTVRESFGMTTMVPRQVEPEPASQLRPFEDAYEAIVLESENLGFACRGTIVTDPGLRLVFHDAEPEAAVLRWRNRVPRARRHVPGTVAYLSNFGIDNYYHWMQFTLPLLRFYGDLDAIDGFYVGPSWLLSAQEETLAWFGIGSDRVVRDACTADRLLAAFVPNRVQEGRGASYRDSRSHAFVRTALVAAPQRATPARIYVTRGAAPNRRGLLNEDEVIALVRRFGFETVSMSGRSVREQAGLFAGADFVVGVHGAALTNVLFSRPGTAFVELFHPRHLEMSYFSTATHSRLDYGYVLGDTTARSPHDFVVDVRKLELLLREFGIAA
jgi:capsular polysaccharide biosynthesis protein